jgi:HAD superfamily hydrolase (TIGR01484 family)
MPSLLATDLDGTVIPLDSDPRHDGPLEALRRAFSERGNLRLAYVTGRHLELARAGIDEHRLPPPDFLSCDVGTSLYEVRDGAWSRLEDYREAMREAWGGRKATDVAAVLKDVRGIVPQSHERQGEFKCSFDLPDASTFEPVLDDVHSRLAAAGIEASLVSSQDPVTGLGLLDVLPPDVTKATALSHLRRTLELPLERVVYAGDSGNDTVALLSGVKAILVGNAPAALKESVSRRAAEMGIERRIYVARSPYAGGVLEGCRHFGLFAGEATSRPGGA